MHTRCVASRSPLPQIGVRSGEEFRAARRAAEGCDAQLVLGDRPIEVTLRRAWDALSWGQRWRLGRRLASRCASGNSPPQKAPNAERLCCCKTPHRIGWKGIEPNKTGIMEHHVHECHSRALM